MRYQVYLHEPYKYAWDLLFGGEESVEVSDILEKAMIEHVENLGKRVISNGVYHIDCLRKIRSSWINDTLGEQYTRENNTLDLIREIKDRMREYAFDECVIAWHVATDICYVAPNKAQRDSEVGLREAMYRVSSYMMYLLLKRSSMMPPGIAELRTLATNKHMRHVLETSPRDYRQPHLFFYTTEVRGVEEKPHNYITLYEDSLDRDLDRDQKGVSALELVSFLVKHLKKIGEEQSWKVIGDAWMEMLTYAALHCSTTEHARSLSRGGELLTHYWLLLAHYGILDEYNAKYVQL